MILSRARATLEALAEAFRPACHRIEIAGSVRRAEWNPSDGELVAIPRYREEPAPGQESLLEPAPPVSINLLHERIDELGEDGLRIRPLKPGVKLPAICEWDPELVDPRWPEKRADGSKYYRLYLPRVRMKVDIFMGSAEEWGCMYTIRTGSRWYSQALVTRWTKRTGGHCLGNRLHPPAKPGQAHVAVHPKTGTRLAAPIDTPEELDVFEAVGLEWPDPKLRTQRAALEVAA